MNFANIVDRVLEAPIFTSFTKIGYAVRRRLAHWEPLDDFDLSEKVVVITGATSGIGKAAALQLAKCGATLIITGRTSDKNDLIVQELQKASGNNDVSQLAADMGDYEQVRQLAAEIVKRHNHIDVLLHNAGALATKRHDAPDGTEATVASQLVGPFLLTNLLLKNLGGVTPSRVLTMSSGGMYSASLEVEAIEMSAEEYKGSKQYALAKRGQVSLNELWAERYGKRNIFFHTLHPGWAATPGVDEALPMFSKILGPFLRTPEQGADTLVWLAASDKATETNGDFWHDRRKRPIHKLSSTRKSDTAKRRQQLWDWVGEIAGVQVEPDQGQHPKE